MCGCGGLAVAPPFFGGAVALDEEDLIEVEPAYELEFQSSTPDPKLVKQYLKTLRRIPPKIFKDLATRDLNLEDGATCIVGWAVRLSLATAAAKTQGFELTDADDITALRGASNDEIVRMAVDAFGGKYAEWDALFFGVAGEDHQILSAEEAFMQRLDELTTRRRRA